MGVSKNLNHWFSQLTGLLDSQEQGSTLPVTGSTLPQDLVNLPFF